MQLAPSEWVVVGAGGEEKDGSMRKEKKEKEAWWVKERKMRKINYIIKLSCCLGTNKQTNISH